jgi:hypothetical protein
LYYRARFFNLCITHHYSNISIGHQHKKQGEEQTILTQSGTQAAITTTTTTITTILAPGSVYSTMKKERMRTAALLK